MAAVVTLAVAPTVHVRELASPGPLRPVAWFRVSPGITWQLYGTATTLQDLVFDPSGAIRAANATDPALAATWRQLLDNVTSGAVALVGAGPGPSLRAGSRGAGGGGRWSVCGAPRAPRCPAPPDHQCAPASMSRHLFQALCPAAGLFAAAKRHAHQPGHHPQLRHHLLPEAGGGLPAALQPQRRQPRQPAGGSQLRARGRSWPCCGGGGAGQVGSRPMLCA